MLRPNIPLAVRVGSIHAVAERCNFPPLLAFLANDHPQVAIASIDRAHLSQDGWLSIIPDLGPLGRSRLRARADLSQTVLAKLAEFGPADFALPAGLSEPATGDSQLASAALAGAGAEANPAELAGAAVSAIAEPPLHDIAELVRRIDKYRSQKAQAAAPTYGVRCDSDGRIRALTGLSRARFVGLSLAEPARPTETGCDAGVARAFGKRAPIRDGRLFLNAEGLEGGYWLIDADPEFDRDSGRFVGYAGSLRRMPDQAAANDGDQPVAATTDAVADSMRQLVHELRSPLNAISGFAQLIHGQFFGPVSQSYRALATGIMDDANHLTHALEDIDLAARLDTGAMFADTGESDLQAAYSAATFTLARGRAIPQTIPIRTGPSAPLMISVPAVVAEQIVQRLLAAVAALSSGAEGIEANLVANPATSMAQLTIVFPSELSPSDFADALEHDTSVAPEDGLDVLGPGFGLRLAGQLAQLHGGKLLLMTNTFILNLPLLHGAHGRFGQVS